MLEKIKYLQVELRNKRASANTLDEKKECWILSGAIADAKMGRTPVLPSMGKYLQ